MAAVVNIYISTGAAEATARATAEGGLVFNREDTLAGTTARLPIPTTTGTAFSWHKTLYLYVVSGGGATSLLNRKINYAGALDAGMKLWYKDVVAVFTASALAAADAGTNGATPSGYTQMSTTATSYDASTIAATNSTRNGDLLQVALGVDFLYAGGGGSAKTVATNVTITYDEQ